MAFNARVRMARVRMAGDIEGWRDIIGSAFGALEIDARADRPFHGRFRFAGIGELVIAEINCANEDAQRTRRHIASDSEEAFAFAFTRNGTLELAQFGRTLSVPAGCFSLLDLNSPYRLRHAEATDLVTLKIPAPMLRLRVPDPRRHVLEAYRADRGIARISRDLLLSLAAECDAVPDPLAQGYAARVADMFAMLIEGGRGDAPEDCSAVSEALLRRCRAIVEARIGNPELDPAAIAAAAGISVRYLHKLFATTGQSACDYIRLRRLQRCRDELADPARARASIKSIALNCGFRNQSHFSHAFRRQFGATPRSAKTALQ